MSNNILTNGVRLLQPWTNDEGILMGSFIREGSKWWTVYWKDAGTLSSDPEKEILHSYGC